MVSRYPFLWITKRSLARITDVLGNRRIDLMGAVHRDTTIRQSCAAS